MIKIFRGDCPNALKTSTSANAYRAEEVVRELWKMQHKKCCYCEASIPKKGHLKAVEHFRPKSVFKGLRNDWKNLLLVCSQCNGTKSDKFPVELTKKNSEPEVVYVTRETRSKTLLIDPSDEKEDPESHLEFVVGYEHELRGMIRASGDSKKGRETIDVVGLDDEFYTSEHRKFLRNLHMTMLGLFEADDTGDKQMKKLYVSYFRQYVRPKGQFTGLARHFVRTFQIDKKFGVKIP